MYLLSLFQLCYLLYSLCSKQRKLYRCSESQKFSFWHFKCADPSSLFSCCSHWAACELKKVIAVSLSVKLKPQISLGSDILIIEVNKALFPLTDAQSHWVASSSFTENSLSFFLAQLSFVDGVVNYGFKLVFALSNYLKDWEFFSLYPFT